MIEIKLIHNRGYKWFYCDDVFVKGYIFLPDGKLLCNKELTDYFSNTVSFEEFLKKTQQANGLFSVVMRRNDSVWAAIDHSRAFPLFYFTSNDSFFITDAPELLKEYEIPLVVNKKNAVIFEYCGFTTGNKTLLDNIFQLQAGECLAFEKKKLKTEFHTSFPHSGFIDIPRTELKNKLKQVLDEVGKRMVEYLNGRQVIVSLSGGYDSRLVAYLLRKNNYRNVLCYTFGLSDCVEKNNARQTAENLGFEFYFVDYGKYKDFALSTDPEFCDYAGFATAFSAVFAEQDYLAMHELRKLNKISADAVVVSGNSGAVAGDLLSEQMANPDFDFVGYLTRTVFAYVFPYKSDREIIRKDIAGLNEPAANEPAWLRYEKWRFRETTAKFGYQAAKIWDYFNCEYLLPLADKALFDFFVKIPFQHKFDKNLYKETLSELFDEYGINFIGKELYPSEKLLKKVAFRSRLTNRFKFLLLFKKTMKNDTIGARYYVRSFKTDLQNAGNFRKKLNVNGYFSEWYLLKINKLFLKYGQQFDYLR